MNMSYHNSIVQEVKKLRSKGKTYSEIIATIGIKIPKSTLSGWCKNIILQKEYKEILDKKILNGGRKGLSNALIFHQLKRKEYLINIYNKNEYLIEKLMDNDFRKLALSMLYLCEGSKRITRSSLTFGNSDPYVISLYLKLLIASYIINEKKFRCTVQCRADQNITKLKSFWRKITGIPSSQFYKTQIDKRTIGKQSKKNNYMGVCRIDYFSAHIFHEL